MSEVIKNLLLVLGAQIPVIGLAFAWWSGVLNNPLLAAGLAVVYESIVFVWGFLGKDVWEELKPDIVKASTDWIKVSVLNVLSGFRSRYNRHMVYEHRVFGVRGLRTSGQAIVELNKVFVELNVAPSHALQVSTNPLHAKSLPDSQPIWDFLRQFKNNTANALAILGPPGCGKTTLLKHLALIFAVNHQRRYRVRAYTPILLSLREHAKTIIEEEPSLVELTQEHFSNQKRYPELDPPPKWFHHQLRAGKCLVLLDGLNEVNGNQQKTISNWVERQIRQYPDCYFILTGRPQGYVDAPLLSARVLEVMPFSDRQVEQFVRNWFLATKIMLSGKDDRGIRRDADSEADDLLRRLREQPTLQELTVNPLLLTMIANVHNYRGALPRRRIELYAEICDVLLSHWRRAKGIDDELSAKQKRTVLQPLAEEMMGERLREFTMADVLATIEPYLVSVGLTKDDTPAFLKKIQEQSGLLVENELDVWGFAHLTFQEYLCAAHWHETAKPLSWNSTDWKIVVEDSWWHETLRFYAAQAGDSTPIVEACLQSNTITSLQLAQNIAEEALKIDPQISEILYAQLKFQTKSSKPSISRCPIQIEFAGRSGFYIDQENFLRLKITNVTNVPIQNVTIELDDTPKYSVDNKGHGKKVFTEIQQEESVILEFPIIVHYSGLITLQLKVNSKVYQDNILEIHATGNNPYFFGPPVKKAQYFFGRELELQTSLNNITRNAGTHTMIIGEQRSGKTSLLFHIQERLQVPYIPVYISFLGGDRRDEEVALHWLLDQILEVLNRRKLLPENYRDTSFQFKYCSDFTKFFESIVQNLQELNRDYKLVLLLDEAHLMNDIDIKFQEILRETFNKMANDVRVILACYYDFFENLKTSGSPLQNIFEYVFLKPLEGKDLAALITKPAKHFGYNYEEQAEKSIEVACGGHPYYCQFLCAKSFTEAERERSKIITQIHVEKAKKQVIADDKKHFEMGYWVNMTKEERTLVKKLLSREVANNVSKKVINRLKHKFIIKEFNGKYLFTATLFREWLKQLIQED